MTALTLNLPKPLWIIPLILSGQLDEMAAQAEAATERLNRREAEFTKLTQDSEAELDRVMTVVRGALERSLGA